MDFVTTVLLGFALGWMVLAFQRKRASLPPGPFPFPIVGSLFSLEEPLHRHFAKLAKKYGPIFYFKIGSIPVVVVSNKETAAQVLKSHDLEFANRPTSSECIRLFSYNNNNITFSQPDEEWKKMRRICAAHLFSNNMLRASSGFRKSELNVALKSVSSSRGAPFDLKKIMSEMAMNSMCLTLFGIRGLDHDLVHLVKTIEAQTLTLNIGSVIPVLDRLDLHGINKRMKMELMPQLRSFLEDQVVRHQAGREQAGESFVPQDFVDVLLTIKDKEKLSDVNMVAMISDMLFGGLDTSVTTLEWTMAELLNNPEVMCKAQDEIDKVVGRGRLVEESDLKNLPYIEAILKESLRLHPPGPTGVPHKNDKQVVLNGHTIPAGCQVFINIWAIGRDPGHWPDPEVYEPDRFLGSGNNFSVGGQNFELIPFSSGRRMCPGYPLMIRSLPYFLAGLLQAFEWNAVLEHGSSSIKLEEHTVSLSMKLLSELIVTASARVDEKIL